MSIRRTILILFLALIAYLLFWPVDIQPMAWTPPEPPVPEGVWAPNDYLNQLSIHGLNCQGCEDIAVDSLGRVYGGTKDGYLLRFTAGQCDTLIHTGGRPLGMAWDSLERLVIADAKLGVVRYTPSSGDLNVLTDNYQGQPFGLADDLDVAPDGCIYFSDASDRWAVEDLRVDFMEHGANGALYRYDPSTQVTDLLVDNGYFTNGVAVSLDGSYLLYNETSVYRVMKYHLKGPRSGQTEVLIEGLPGFPDGISAAADGSYWLTLIYPRQKTLDFSLPRPWLRRLFRRIPKFLLPKPAHQNRVLQINAEGEVLRSLQDSSPSYHSISSVEQFDQQLFLGTLEDQGFGIFPLGEKK